MQPSSFINNILGLSPHLTCCKYWNIYWKYDVNIALKNVDGPLKNHPSLWLVTLYFVCTFSLLIVEWLYIIVRVLLYLSPWNTKLLLQNYCCSASGASKMIMSFLYYCIFFPIFQPKAFQYFFELVRGVVLSPHQTFHSSGKHMKLLYFFVYSIVDM